MNRKPSALLALVSLVGFSAFATTYYAKPNGADDATCVDEANAGSISNAVAKALKAAGNVVSLADGDYDCSGIRNTSQPTYAFYINQNITMKSASDDPDKARLIGGGSAKAKSCFYMAATFKLQAVTVTNFSATAGNGVAISVNSGTTTLTNCTIAGCSATSSAAACAIYQKYGAKVYFYDCRIRNCSSASSYASIYAWGSTVYGYDSEISFCTNSSNNCSGAGPIGGTYTRCRIFGNCTMGTGANAFGAVGQATFVDCVVSNCHASANSTFGKYNAGSSVKGCTIVNMPAGTTIGSAYDTFSNCVFSNNLARVGGGALKNCLLVSNVFQTTSKVGFYSGTAENCTFVGNYTPGGDQWQTGGLIVNGSVLKNCIIADNVPGSRIFITAGNSPVYLTNTMYTAKGSGTLVKNDACVKLQDPATSGVSEFDQVKFVGANDKGLPYYSLQRKSPAVDKGDNLAYTAASLDLAGNPRVVTKGRTLAANPNAVVDLGCYENQEKAPGLIIVIR